MKCLSKKCLTPAGIEYLIVSEEEVLDLVRYGYSIARVKGD